MNILLALALWFFVGIAQAQIYGVDASGQEAQVQGFAQVLQDISEDLVADPAGTATACRPAYINATNTWVWTGTGCAATASFTVSDGEYFQGADADSGLTFGASGKIMQFNVDAAAQFRVNETGGINVSGLASFGNNIATPQAFISANPAAGAFSANADINLKLDEDNDGTNFLYIKNGLDADVVTVSETGAVDALSLALGQDLVLDEQADHASTPEAGKGYVWVQNTTPSTLVFTDDAGADVTLGACGRVRDFTIPAASMVPRATNGAEASTRTSTTNEVMSDVYLFDAIVSEAVQFDLNLPQAWDAGTLKARFVWSSSPGGTPSELVTWGIACRALGDNTAIDVAFGAPVTIQDTLQSLGTEHWATTGDITATGTPAAGSALRCEVSRSAGGMSVDATLYRVQLQYTENVTCPSVW